MCGISGIVSKNIIAIESNELSNFFNSALTHRGPDENINFNVENLGFFHMSRLAINDLRLNQYPLSSNDNKIKLIYNGEIYNFSELRDLLIRLGYSFKTRVDGEVIINGYLEWGNEVWNKLNGIFSACLIDEYNQQIILARDFLGVKPLFYFLNQGRLVFASELVTLVKFAQKFGKRINFDLNLNQTSLNELYDNMFLQSLENTVYENMYSVKPGHYYIFDLSVLKASKYWNINDFNAKNKFNNDTLDDFEQVFTQAVSKQLVSDVPVALALSSGLDSNTLLNTILHLEQNDINAYTANFLNDNRSETNLILNDLGNKKTRIKVVDIDPLHLSQNLDKYVDVYSDLVTLDGGAITTKILSREMNSDGIKVCIFGEGADELFGGYTWFGLASGIYKLAPKKVREIGHLYAISRKLNFEPSIYNNIKYLSPFKTIQIFELTNQLPSHLLAKVDRSTMSESIEGRVPFLDKNLVEFVLNLNDSNMVPRNKLLFLPDPKATKPILRNYASKKLNLTHSTRPKKGFMLPIDSIIKASKIELLDLLSSKDFVFKDTNSNKINNLISTLKKDKHIRVTDNWLLWRLLVIQKVINNNKNN